MLRYLLAIIGVAAVPATVDAQVSVEGLQQLNSQLAQAWTDYQIVASWAYDGKLTYQNPDAQRKADLAFAAVQLAAAAVNQGGIQGARAERALAAGDMQAAQAAFDRAEQARQYAESKLTAAEQAMTEASQIESGGPQ